MPLLLLLLVVGVAGCVGFAALPLTVVLQGLRRADTMHNVGLLQKVFVWCVEPLTGADNHSSYRCKTANLNHVGLEQTLLQYVTL